MAVIYYVFMIFSNVKGYILWIMWHGILLRKIIILCGRVTCAAQHLETGKFRQTNKSNNEFGRDNIPIE
jgi:hypothetical protein